MATLTKGKTFTNGETVTPQKLHELVDLGTVSGIVNADIAAGAAIADSKLAQITTVGKVANSATSATNANTANAIVARDGSGNFSAGTISANLSGNATTATSAATATTLQTARTINGVSFNGSANITVTADPNAHTHDDRYYTETEINTLLAGCAPATGIAPSAITGTAVITTDSRLSDARTPSDGSVTDAKISSTAAIADSKLATISTAGKVSNSATTATNANTANAIVARDTSGNFSAGTITAALSGNAATATTAASCSGNAATATTLQTARTINGVSFNGSADITVTANPNTHTHDDRYYTETEITTLLSDKQKINGQISSGLNWNGNTGILFNIPENVKKLSLVVENWSHPTAGQGIVLVGTTTAGILNAEGPTVANSYWNNVNNVEDFSGFSITGRTNTTANHTGIFDFFIGKNPGYLLNNNLPVNRLVCRSNLQQYTGGNWTSTLLNGAGYVDFPGVLNQILLRPMYGSTSPGPYTMATLYFYY